MTVKDDRHPLLDPTITLGHILTAIPLLISMIWFLSQIDAKIANLEAIVTLQRASMQQIEARIETVRIETEQKRVDMRIETEDRLRTVKSDINARLDKVETKLDRILDFIVETHPK